MRINDVVFWSVDSIIKFGVVRKITTIEDATETQCKLSIELEDESVAYRDENSVTVIYGSYDSELQQTVNTIIESLVHKNDQPVEPENEQPTSGESKEDTGSVADDAGTSDGD